MSDTQTSDGSLFNTGVRPAIDEWLLAESRKVRDYGDYWSASSAGYCMRKILFERLGVPYVEKAEDGRKQRLFTAGHLFHAWMQGLTKNAGISIVQEVELQDEEIMVRGHFDDLIKGKDGLVLYDYKTVNSMAFNYKKDEMSHYHKMQLGTYMYMLRTLQHEEVKLAELSDLPELKEARTLLISKDDLRMKEQAIIWTPDLEKEVLDFWAELNNHWEDKTFPECTCDKYEEGFMAKPKWNPYYFDGEPCSIKYYKQWKDNNGRE